MSNIAYADFIARRRAQVGHDGINVSVGNGVVLQQAFAALGMLWPRVLRWAVAA